MKNTKRYLSATLGFALMAAIVAFSLPQTGHSSVGRLVDKDVRVTNTTAEPVPVMLAGPQRPFQYEVDVIFGGTYMQSEQSTPIPIPAGKMAVIENVSVFGKAPDDAQMRYHIGIATRVQPDTAYRFHNLNFTTVNPPFGSSPNEYTVSQMVKIYCDAPEIFARVTRQHEAGEFGAATFKFVVSGYLVDKLTQ